MNSAILEEAGLSKTEIKLYVALLKLGSTTTTPLMRESQVPASKVYEFLDKLAKKGLVTHVTRNNKLVFTAATPENINHFLDTKKDEINEVSRKVQTLIPELNAFKGGNTNQMKAFVFEGFSGLRSLCAKNLEVLKKGQTHYIIGAPKIGNEKMEGMLLDWHKNRVKKGIKCKYIYDFDARKYGEIRQKMALTEVRYLSKESASPVWIEVFGDYVATGHFSNNGVIVFLINDGEIAKKYLHYFELLWHASSK